MGKALSELVSEGWTPRNVSEGARLAEAVAGYEALGFEVATIPASEIPDYQDCTACFPESPDSGGPVLVLTRKSPE